MFNLTGMGGGLGGSPMKNRELPRPTGPVMGPGAKPIASPIRARPGSGFGRLKFPGDAGMRQSASGQRIAGQPMTSGLM